MKVGKYKPNSGPLSSAMFEIASNN